MVDRRVGVVEEVEHPSGADRGVERYVEVGVRGGRGLVGGGAVVQAGEQVVAW